MGLFSEEYACTICVLTQAAEETCQLLLGQPDLMTEFLRSTFAHIPERQSWWKGLFGTKRRTTHQFPQSSAHIDLDKAWHGIHYLLAGAKSGGEMPAGFLLYGGKHLVASRPQGDGLVANWQRLLVAASRDINVFHQARGPARVLTATEVRTVRDFLSPLQWPELKSRYDSRLMREVGIYPFFWQEDPHDVGAALYLRDHFFRLREFVKQVAISGDGMIIHFCSATVFGSATRWH